MSIFFTKMHGNGNDFVIIDEMKEVVIPQEMKPEFAKAYCDRKFGIGADGILFISKPETDGAIVRMQLFQPDGSEAAMCGNGIRCLAKYAFDKEYAKTKSFKIQTKAGILSVRGGYDNDGDYMVAIDMGTAVFGKEEKIAGMTVASVNTGVPHAVVIVDSIDEIDIETIAPQIRNNPAYPEGTNVNFIQVTGKDEIAIRTYERGVEGETLSCGTGATASALVAAAKKLVSGKIVHVSTVGGPLDITVGEKTPVMTGPAETVFEGEIPF